MPITQGVTLARTVAAASGNVYNVPGSVTCDGSTDSTLLFWNWFNTAGPGGTRVPDGSTVRFQTCNYAYAEGGNGNVGGDNVSGAFELIGCNNITIDGAGCTFTAVSQGSAHRNAWLLYNCTGCVLTNFTVNGPLGRFTARGAPDFGEFQCGVVVCGGSGNTINADITITNTFGYLVYVLDRFAGQNPTGTPAYPPPKNTTINCTCNTNGPIAAQGIAIICADGVTIGGTVTNPTATCVDVESSYPSQITRNITISGATLSNAVNTVVSVQGYASGTLAYDGLPRCENIVIKNATLSTVAYTLNQPIVVRSVDGVPIPNVSVTGNTITQGAGAFAFPNYLDNISGLTYTGNTQHGAFNDRNSVMDVTGMTGTVTVTSNAIDGGQPGGLLYGLSGTGTSGATLTYNTNTNWPASNNLS